MNTSVKSDLIKNLPKLDGNPKKIKKLESAPPKIKSSTGPCIDPCIDAKTMVLVIAALLLVSELVRGVWNFNKEPIDYLNGGFCAVTVFICLLLYINVLALPKMLALYIVVATTLTILFFVKLVFKVLEEVAKKDHKEIPEFDSFMLLLVLIVGIVQLYRINSNLVIPTNEIAINSEFKASNV